MIHIRNIRKRRAGQEALRGIDVKVAEGEVAALIGGSGSGKTTLLRCINGLESFDEGSIDAFGTRLEGGTPLGHAALATLRRDVGMVFQGFHLFPHLDVIENLTLAPCTVSSEAKTTAEDRASALLERMGLKGRERSRTHALSGGQQQRVAIARALMMKPKALLLDEPTSALDPKSAADVLDVLLELKEGGQTMIIATHAMGFAKKAATTVHVLAEGACVESGSPAAVLETPRHEATKRILDAVQYRG